MKLFRLTSVCAAAVTLIAVQALPASQSEQTTETTTKAAKKARTKAKKTAEQTTDTAGKSAASATQTAPGEQGTAQAPEAAKTRKAKTKATGSAERAVPTVSESEIAAAKASSKVWVNTETGVYHKGGQWYGATKQGKFMTEDEAIKSGYRASKTK